MVEAMTVTHVPESPRARQSKEESTTTAGELGDDDRAALTTDGSTVVPKAMAGTAGSLGAKAGVASDALEIGAVKPMVPKGKTAVPEASHGMVRPAVRPRSPSVVPRATVEEDEVEEIEHAEP